MKYLTDTALNGVYTDGDDAEDDSGPKMVRSSKLIRTASTDSAGSYGAPPGGSTWNELPIILEGGE